MWLISSYQIATPIGLSLMWIPLDRVRGHFCVFRATPLCLVVVFAVGNDAADIYPFTNPWAEFHRHCTVDVYLFYVIRPRRSDA